MGETLSTIDTYSQEHKHRCLVRYILRLRCKSQELGRQELFGDGKKWPGYKVKNPKVFDDVVRQWKLGNRGNPGEWYERDE